MVDILKDESREGTGIDVIEDTSRNFYSGEKSKQGLVSTKQGLVSTISFDLVNLKAVE